MWGRNEPGYKPLHACGRTLTCDFFQSLMTNPPHTQRPIVGVGIAVFDRDDILLVRRGRPPRLGEWSLPGGKQQHGEGVHAAALRELYEETAVRAEIVGLVDVVDVLPAPHDPATPHYTLIDFAALWRSGRPRAGDDAADARFWPLDALDAMVLWDETRRVIRQAYAMTRQVPAEQKDPP